MWTVIFGANIFAVYIVPIILSWTINTKYSLCLQLAAKCVSEGGVSLSDC